jgi:hypothetical protein
MQSLTAWSTMSFARLTWPVAPWISHRGVVDVDEADLAEVPEVRPYKGLSQVGDDPVTYPEPMGNVLDELRGLFRRDCSDGADLDPLGKYVHRN